MLIEENTENIEKQTGKKSPAIPLFNNDHRLFYVRQ